MTSSMDRTAVWKVQQSRKFRATCHRFMTMRRVRARDLIAVGSKVLLLCFLPLSTSSQLFHKGSTMPSQIGVRKSDCESSEMASSGPRGSKLFVLDLCEGHTSVPPASDSSPGTVVSNDSTHGWHPPQPPPPQTPQNISSGSPAGGAGGMWRASEIDAGADGGADGASVCKHPGKIPSMPTHASSSARSMPLLGREEVMGTKPCNNSAMPAMPAATSS
mmetsp:Transcript_29083/g.83498  ORF Transcript_29083/g.83498 Transcript_29083/m.83498 type:complete len:218 (+) Transcript_29083:173-826(+)